MSLSKREKTLLYVLAVIIIVVGGWVGIIIPAVKEKQVELQRVQLLEAEQEQMKVMLEQMQGVEGLLDIEQKRFAADTYFYHGIKDVFVDRALQAIKRKHGMTVVSLKMENPIQGDVIPFTAIYDSFGQLVLAEAAKAMGNGTTEGEPTVTNNPTMPMYICTLTVEGTPDAFMSVVNEINSGKKSLYVSDFKLLVNKSKAVGSNERYEGEITVKIYFSEE